MAYGHMDLTDNDGRSKAVTWTNVDIPSNVICRIRQMAISNEVLNIEYKMRRKITLLK